MAETVQRIADVRGPHAEVVAGSTSPASFVILDRVVWGVSALLGKLEAEAPWRASSTSTGSERLRAPARRAGRRLARWIDCRVQPSVARRWRDEEGLGQWLIRTRPGRRSHRGTGELPGLFDVEESARRVGNYKWAEMKLFEALGGWVATVPELDVKLRLGTHCYKHAWHAELWHKRLPELREMNPDRMTKPANEAMERFVEALTEPEAPELTLEKLVGVYRVFIPRFVAAYVPPQRHQRDHGPRRPSAR